MGNFFVSEDDAHFLEAIKLSNALELSFYKDEVLYLDIPNREDYESLEDFNKANTQFMVNKVDEIKNIKHTTFVSTLKAYNDILNDVYKIKRCDSEEGRLFNEMIDYSNNDIRKILNVLQCLKIVYKSNPIFENNVIKYLNITKKQEIKTLCYKLKTQNIAEFMKDYDIYQYPDLIQLLYDIYENITLTPKQIIEFTDLEIMVYKGISYINFYTYLCSLFKL